MKRICRFVLSGALCAAAFGQSPAARAEFEVASIKPSPPQMPNMASIGLHVDGAQLRCNYLPLREYIRMAYRLKDNQISGPDWIDTTRFDIAAKIPEGIARDKVLDMLQHLLEDRFSLKTHHETKDLPVYALVQAKGGFKLQALPAEPEDGPRAVDVSASGGPGGVTVSFGDGASFSLGNNKFTIKKLSIEQFASALSRFTDREVVDQTNARGKYDFSVDMTPEDYRAVLIRSAIKAGVVLPPEAMRLVEGQSGESLFLSLQQVGLKMESRKAPVEVTVVDQIAKTAKED
jgi:uncharacterized protein (TIGR03435 family)